MVYCKKKMLKIIYACDCFLDIAHYCLEITVDFAHFQTFARCNDIFIIHNWSQRRSNFSPIKFVECCKSFVGFQIDLFVKENSFTLRSVVCNYAWTRCNIDDDGIDFDYKDKFMQTYCDSDNNDNDEKSRGQQSNCFVSSVCLCEMRTNLEFTRFCLKCKGTLLRYFMQKLHLITKKRTC